MMRFILTWLWCYCDGNVPEPMHIHYYFPLMRG